MKKTALAAALFALCAVSVFSQARAPVLAILPFTGGAAGDGDAIVTLLSFRPEITGAFTVVPRTAALNALFAEHSFQLGGLTDADTIAGIGHILNADYVLSGSIRRLGGVNIVIATVIRVETFELVAGYHRRYRAIEEVQEFLPAMAARLVETVFRDTSALPNLAIMPLDLAGISLEDAETLANILAIELLRTGRYALLPRTTAIGSALAEHDFQMAGFTADEGLAGVGRAFNAAFVLSIGINSLGGLNMFAAQILDVRDGSLLTGDTRDYRAISDGVDLMGELAILLTVPPGAERNRMISAHRGDPVRVAERRRREEEARAQEREERRQRRAAAAAARRLRRAPVIANARRDLMEFSFSYVFEEPAGEAPAAFALGLGLHRAPFPFVSLGFEAKIGWRNVEAEPGLTDVQYLFSASPALGIVIPLGRSTRLFSTAMLDLGQFGPWDGMLTGWATPGFDAGIEFVGPAGGTFNVRYRGIFFEEAYVHGIGASLGFRF